jgi:hypothetical protein
VKLPRLEKAYVPEAKVVQYLLNLEHMGGGKEKAVFFLSFGFTMDDWQLLAKSLLDHAETHEVVNVNEKSESTTYALEGELVTPDGRNPRVRTVWALDTDSDVPRFVTAYPAK